MPVIFLLAAGCSQVEQPALAAGTAKSAEVVASSCAESDVQAAIDATLPGGTVMVPAGRADWRSPIAIPQDITLEGAGIDRTVIVNPNVNPFDSLVTVHLSDGGSFRITGFTFLGANGSADDMADAIVVLGSASGFRIDHDKFESGGSYSIWIHGAAYGKIENNEFIDPANVAIMVLDEGTGDDSWNRPLELGGPDAVYVQNNVFQLITKGVAAIDGVNGARYVFRYNTVNQLSYENSDAAEVQAQGNFQVDYFDYRGARSFEIYGNLIESGGSRQAILIQGGSGVIFDNTFVGTYYEPIFFTDLGAFLTLPGGAGTCGYAYCTYPTPDQISDVYVWNNRYQGATVNPVVDSQGDVPQMVQAARDYFLTPMPGYSPAP